MDALERLALLRRSVQASKEVIERAKLDIEASQARIAEAERLIAEIEALQQEAFRSVPSTKH